MCRSVSPTAPVPIDLRNWETGPGKLASAPLAEVTALTSQQHTQSLAYASRLKERGRRPIYPAIVMAHRLPTHLNSIIPPPAEQVQQRRPWQGTLTLTFMNTTQGACQDVFATAAETDGERCAPNAVQVVTDAA